MESAIVTFANDGVQPALYPEEAKTMPVRLPGGIDYPAGKVLGARTGNATNEVQTVTITGTPTGGTFTLTFYGQTTSAIAYNASAATVEAALEALSTIGADNVACAGGALPGTAVTVTFQGDLAGRNVPLLTSNNSLTGGTNPAITVTKTTPGSVGQGQFEDYDDAASDGTEVAKAILQRRTKTNEKGQILDDLGTDTGKYDTPAWIKGYFYTADLTGLDAAAVTDLGRLVTGNTSILTATTTVLKVN